MASSPLSAQPLHPFTRKPPQNPNPKVTSLQFHPCNISNHRSRKNTKLFVFATASSSSSSNLEKEEQRWLREEQRWIREENRWIREESRWNSERESLLREISGLKLRIEALERQISVQGGSAAAAAAHDAVSEVEALVQVLKEAGLDLAKMNRTAESGGSGAARAGPMLLESEGEEVKEMVVSEVKVSEGRVEEKMKKKRVSLRMGSEGAEVREMQEALLKLGFYSGEEDMEYSSFSSGTERAVKTWQSTLGAPEDGIMTSDLLKRLFMEQVVADDGVGKSADYGTNSISASEKVNSNGISAASVTEISEIQQTIVKENENSEVEVSHHRVYLLGENRWEEPSRLTGRDKKVGMNNSAIGTKNCIACRGEGRLSCMECDGTGEPNVEPQFLEWVGEDAKCPYCEGLGYTICDVCEGKQVIPI